MFPGSGRLNGALFSMGQLAQRLRPSPAMIVALLAVSLSTAGIAYAGGIGSAGIIDNSIQSVDLRDGAAVKGVDVVDNSLAGADINEAALNGVARKLHYATQASSPAPKTTLATVGGYTFKGKCEFDGQIIASIWVNGPAGDVQWSSMLFNDNDFTDSGSFAAGVSLAGATDQAIQILGTFGSVYSRIAATVWIHSGTTLLEVHLNLVADARPTAAHDCFAYGSATRLV